MSKCMFTHSIHPQLDIINNGSSILMWTVQLYSCVNFLFFKSVDIQNGRIDFTNMQSLISICWNKRSHFYLAWKVGVCWEASALDFCKSSESNENCMERIKPKISELAAGISWFEFFENFFFHWKCLWFPYLPKS